MPPSEEFGTYKDGSSIYKNKNGYYILQYDHNEEIEFKKYLKNWEPKKSDSRLILDKKKQKWKIIILVLAIVFMIFIISHFPYVKEIVICFLLTIKNIFHIFIFFLT